MKKPNNLNAIPEKGTNFVVIADLPSILKKGNFDEVVKKFKSNSIIKKQFFDTDTFFNSIIDSAIKNPEITGIDFNSDLFVFNNKQNKEEYNCLSLEINNKDNFSGFVQTILNNYKNNDSIINKAGYSFIEPNEEFLIAWDNRKAVFLVRQYTSDFLMKDKIDELMNLKESNRISNNKKFDQFYKDKKDVSVLFSSNLTVENIDKSILSIDKSSSILKDNFYGYYIDFQKGNISFSTTVMFNDELTKTFENSKILNQTLNSELLKYFPEKTYFLSSFALNPTAYYDYFSKYVLGMFDSKLTKDVKLEKLKKEIGFDLKDISETLKGSFVYSLYDFQKINYTAKSWGICFDETQSKFMGSVFKIKQAGTLSFKQMELLNQGKTIQIRLDGKEYGINIQNLLSEDKDIEYAIKTNSKVNLYLGGWKYGKCLETEKVIETFPMMNMAFDVKDDKILNQLSTYLLSKNIVKKQGNYYSFLVGDFPAYFAFNKNTCFLSNDTNQIKSFLSGKGLDSNLNNSSFKSNVMKDNVYGYLNLTFDNYPENVKSLVNKQPIMVKSKLMLWLNFFENIEMNQVGEMNSITKIHLFDKTENSLYLLLKNIDRTLNP